MIVLINPNSTTSMTQSMLATARKAVPNASVVGWTSHDGPPAIQGPEDGAACIPALLKLVEKASNEGASAIIIGCADDTGLSQALSIARCPVIGIGQAAYHLASLAGKRFSVVTTLEVSVPILEGNISAYGLNENLGRVRASGVPVLDLETDPINAAARIKQEIQTAAEEDNVQSIVLGCAGMVDIPRAFQDKPPVRLIDGVTAAAQISAILA